jgi:two-component system, chemotaxis family, sensor kinase CheA
MTNSSGTISGTLIGADRAREAVTVGVGVLLTAVMGIVLLLGFRLATRVTVQVAGLQTASGLETYPAILNQQITSLRDRLEERAYSGQALSDLRATTESFQRDLQKLQSSRIGRSSELSQAVSLWSEYGPVLDPITSFSGQPYVDTDQGSTFSAGGREHYASVKRAQLFARETSPRLTRALGALSSRLQEDANTEAAQLRLLLSGGVLIALILAGVAAYLHVTGAKVARAARESEEQTRDILRTVREGFFLLDADYRIGAVWSQALTKLFGRKDFAGLPFEELLEGLVSAQTLATATKYIKLLWGERAHENLMKSINPLGQLELHIDNGHGGRDARYLQFDFHRVLGPKGAVKHVLVSASDITSSVLLARELAESQQNANAQVDMMMGVMHLDPVQLGGFLDATETGLTLINTILKEPARTDADFRKKLDGMFRELHSIKGEASAINLMTVAHRVHALEDSVTDLKKAPALSGNEFLPLVVKLDELMAHLKMVRELSARFSSLREAPAAAPAAESRPAERAAAPRRPDELVHTLQQLAARLAGDHRKKLRLDLSGIAEMPVAYRGTLKDVLIQMLRNAAVHGIESTEVRRAHTKDDTGLVRVEFSRKADGFELNFEDDGAGISPEQLKAAAVRRQLLTQQEADNMDNRAAMALIFRPGFSTRDQVSMDAGRGVGMDVVARNIYALGGRIGVSTSPGKFTRFKISLPLMPERADSAVA